MRDTATIASFLTMAGIKPLDKEAVATYQDAEVLRNQSLLWRMFHYIHPSLPMRMLFISFLSVLLGVVLLVCAFTTVRSSPESSVGLLFLCVLSLYSAHACYLHHYDSVWIGWNFISVPNYEERHGSLPTEAYRMIYAIRKVTDKGVFKVKVIGDDPILNFGFERQEFDPPPERYDLLIWDGRGNIVTLP